MRSAHLLVPCLVLLAACPGGDTDTDAVIEVLDPEPAGAPADPVDGRWTCLGDEEHPSWGPGSLQLTGYIRTLADPTSLEQPPAVTIEAFDEDDNAVGTGFSDPSHGGRVNLSVPVDASGFKGHLLLTFPGYLDYRYQASRPFSTSFFTGWAWLTTAAERDAQAAAVGVDVPSDARVMIGAVHDCDGFAVSNAVVTIDDNTDGMLFVEGFEAVAGHTFTTTSGRFVVPEVGGGRLSVAAWGRLEAGGPLQLLGRVDAEGVPGGISAVSLEPRIE